VTATVLAQGKQYDQFTVAEQIKPVAEPNSVFSDCCLMLEQNPAALNDFATKGSSENGRQPAPRSSSCSYPIIESIRVAITILQSNCE
jgi:hypothetical protein